MSGQQELLRLRILLTFLKEDETCTIMGIARTLGETKQNISRAVIILEKEGMIDRTDIRHPVLTVYGKKMAKNYAKKMGISTQFLMDEGVSIENARIDASYWAIHNSDETVEVLEKSCQKNAIKKIVQHRYKFSGSLLNKKLKEGIYQFSFFLHEGISTDLNECFEHPCTCHISSGKGNLSLKCTNAKGRRIKTIQYCDGGLFVSAEKQGDIVRIPFDIVEFVNYGEGSGQIIQGTMCLIIQFMGKQGKLIEEKALFTLFI